MSHGYFLIHRMTLLFFHLVDNMFKKKKKNTRLHQNVYFFLPLKIHKLVTWPHQPELQGSCSLPDPHSTKQGPQQALFPHGMIYLAHNSIWVFNLIQHGPHFFCWTFMVLHYLTHPTCSNSSPRNPGKSPCFQASAGSIPLHSPAQNASLLFHLPNLIKRVSSPEILPDHPSHQDFSSPKSLEPTAISPTLTHCDFFLSVSPVSLAELQTSWGSCQCLQLFPFPRRQLQALYRKAFG